MKDLLEDTYGITVYQEQVMLLSQVLADFTKGDADVLRKAMGKKDKYTLDKLKPKFIENAAAKGHDKKILEKVWTDWEAFAAYAFNKSHSTCYAFVAFQTAYLKAHYPAEYMASVLTHNLSNLEKVTFFMEEAKRFGIPVLGPDVNESQYHFSVNDKGAIRMGLGAMKGVGEAAVIALIDERKANGPFTSIFDLTKRVNLRSVNKRCLESIAYGGALDSLGDIDRAQYFFTPPGEQIYFLEKAIRYGNSFQESKNSSQASLFGDSAEEVNMPEPEIPKCEPWGSLQKLKFEKDVIGMYISGHPLDNFKIEMKFCSHTVSDMKDLPSLKNKEVSLGGMISSVNHRISKNGKPFGSFIIEDYSESFEFALFGEDYLKYKHFLDQGSFLYIKGKVQERWKQENNLEVKIIKMELLPDLREKLVKQVTLHLSVSQLSEALTEEFIGLIHNNPGNCQVKLKVFDITQQGMTIDTESRKYKINLGNDVIEWLTKMDIEYSLN
jgi:DNA polymerase-3 subunit alpha